MPLDVSTRATAEAQAASALADRQIFDAAADTPAVSALHAFLV